MSTVGQSPEDNFNAAQFQLPEVNQNGRIQWRSADVQQNPHRTAATIEKVKGLFRTDQPAHLTRADLQRLRGELVTIRDKAVTHAKTSLGGFWAFFFGGYAEKKVMQKFQSTFQQIDDRIALSTQSGPQATFGRTTYTIDFNTKDPNSFTVKYPNPNNSSQSAAIPCSIVTSENGDRCCNFTLSGIQYTIPFTEKFLEDFHNIRLVDDFLENKPSPTANWSNEQMNTYFAGNPSSLLIYRLRENPTKLHVSFRPTVGLDTLSSDARYREADCHIEELSNGKYRCTFKPIFLRGGGQGVAFEFANRAEFESNFRDAIAGQQNYAQTTAELHGAL